VALRSESVSNLSAFGVGALRLVSRWGITLPAEDTGGLLLLSSFPVVSSSCPCLFRVEPKVQTPVFRLLEHVFREARSTVDWFAYRRLERHSGGLATVCTCYFEHSSL
jgi:hypothetical protein